MKTLLNKSILITFIFLLIFGCQSMQNKIVEESPKVDFCELPSYRGRLVYTECTYSGLEEYWSIGDKNCDSLETELAFEGSFYDLPDKYQDKFKKAHKNYWNTYIRLKVIGTFENKEKRYGHLGSNNSIFKVKEIVKLKLLKK